LLRQGLSPVSPFSNAVVLLTFEGDTANVIPFSVPGPNGPVGTASVLIFDENGNLFQDTFLPSAGIFVSVDNTNGGVGFGSFGVTPGSPNFPAQVAYPSGMLPNPRSAVATYDLKSDINIDVGDPPMGSAQSCVEFGSPTGCSAPLPLPMTSGDLILNLTQRSAAEFSAVTQQVVPFTSLSAEGEMQKRRFRLRGRLSLGDTSNGISPLSEAVTVQLGSYSVTISPGSFQRSENHGYTFQGKIGDVRLTVSLKAHGPANYTFEMHGAGSGLPRQTKSDSFALTIGDDSGTTTVTLETTIDGGARRAIARSSTGQTGRLLLCRSLL
jgi:hypothetical protein